MPLMQLSTLVLPAPLGPIKASNSPASNVSETPSSTVSPPKRRLNSTTSNSAIPPPVAAVLLDGAVAAAIAAALLAEVEFLDIWVVDQACGIAVEHDAAVLQHVGVVDHLEGDGGALLHQHNGELEFATDVEQAP